jgi:hypothetical protein
MRRRQGSTHVSWCSPVGMIVSRYWPYTWRQHSVTCVACVTCVCSTCVARVLAARGATHPLLPAPHKTAIMPFAVSRQHTRGVVEAPHLLQALQLLLVHVDAVARADARHVIRRELRGLVQLACGGGFGARLRCRGGTRRCLSGVC